MINDNNLLENTHKMKLLWLVSVIIPPAAEAFSLDQPVICGWLFKIYEEISKVHDVVLVFPQCKSEELLEKKDSFGRLFYGFYVNNRHFEKYDKKLNHRFREIIDTVKPDIIHVWGTEFSYSASMIKMFNNPSRTIINVQGVVSDCAHSYMADIPDIITRRWTFRDIIRRDNLVCQKKKFEERGKWEKVSFLNSGNIIGRTDWDEALASMLAPQAEYFFCNEILRDSFYKYAAKWDVKNCKRHSVFISQCYYPIKGFHKLIEAVALLVKEYPDIVIYAAGKTINMGDSPKSRLKQSSYDRYVVSLIKKYNLKKNIIFTGPLNEKNVIEYMLRSNVFVSPSSIENESNALSEAKLLGLPCICSYVGGTTRRIQHEYDGFQYQYEKSYMLAYYLRKIFDNDKLAVELGTHASESAKITNDIETNVNRMRKIYNLVFEKG